MTERRVSYFQLMDALLFLMGETCQLRLGLVDGELTGFTEDGQPWIRAEFEEESDVAAAFDMVDIALDPENGAVAGSSDDIVKIEGDDGKVYEVPSPVARKVIHAEHLAWEMVRYLTYNHPPCTFAHEAPK